MGLPDEYSTVCEECSVFNFSHIKCKECWIKAFKKIIDSCDPEPCCYGINKKELLKKLEEIE